MTNDEIAAVRKDFEGKAGEFIFTFARVDNLLFDLFKLLLGRHERIAAVLFYRNSQFGGRLPLVDDMIDACLSDRKIVERWSKISRAIGSLGEIRNILAHRPFDAHRLVRVGPDGGGRQLFMGAAYGPHEGLVRPIRDVWFEPRDKNSDRRLAQRVDLQTLEAKLLDLQIVLNDANSFRQDLGRNPQLLGHDK